MFLFADDPSESQLLCPHVPSDANEAPAYKHVLDDELVVRVAGALAHHTAVAVGVLCVEHARQRVAKALGAVYLLTFTRRSLKTQETRSTTVPAAKQARTYAGGGKHHGAHVATVVAVLKHDDRIATRVGLGHFHRRLPAFKQQSSWCRVGGACVVRGVRTSTTSPPVVKKPNLSMPLGRTVTRRSMSSSSGRCKHTSGCSPTRR